jgi:hypothetical protein
MEVDSHFSRLVRCPPTGRSRFHFQHGFSSPGIFFAFQQYEINTRPIRQFEFRLRAFQCFFPARSFAEASGRLALFFRAR